MNNHPDTTMRRILVISSLVTIGALTFFPSSKASNKMPVQAAQSGQSNIQAPDQYQRMLEVGYDIPLPPPATDIPTVNVESLPRVVTLHTSEFNMSVPRHRSGAVDVKLGGKPASEKKLHCQTRALEQGGGEVRECSWL